MILDTLRTRRSIRRFSDRKIEADKIEWLKEATLRSPSSRSLNPWFFIVIDDPVLLEKLSRAKAHGASFLKNAPLAFVIGADPLKCDVWIEDCAIATMNLHLAAHSLNLGSCWIQIRKRKDDAGKDAEENVKQLLTIPQDFRILSIVAIGYPAEQKEGHPRENLPQNKFHVNKYDNCGD